MQLELNCKNQSLEWVISPEEVCAGNVNIDSVKFNFCELWNGFTKTAVFHRENAGITIHVLLDEADTCKIPPEITETEGLVYIGVFGDMSTDTEYLRRTTEPMAWYLKDGIAVDGVPSEATPDIYAQIIALCNEAVESAKNAENLADDMPEKVEETVEKYMEDKDFVTRDELQVIIDLINSMSLVKTTSINLLASAWVKDSDTQYSQVVSIDGITPNSKVDLQPTVEQLAIFHEKDITFVSENDEGVVTIYCIGQKPTADYTMQATITEVGIND